MYVLSNENSSTLWSHWQTFIILFIKLVSDVRQIDVNWKYSLGVLARHYFAWGERNFVHNVSQITRVRLPPSPFPLLKSISEHMTCSFFNLAFDAYLGKPPYGLQFGSRFIIDLQQKLKVGTASGSLCQEGSWILSQANYCKNYDNTNAECSLHSDHGRDMCELCSDALPVLLRLVFYLFMKCRWNWMWGFIFFFASQ